MSGGFCGNPFNHEPHDVEKSGKTFFCDGVDRPEVKPEVIAKYDPTEQAEDGTTYSKVTILIEDAKGNVTIIHAPKSAFIQLEAERQKYVPIDVVSRDFVPEIEKATFSFTPRTFKDEPAFTIERKSANG